MHKLILPLARLEMSLSDADASRLARLSYRDDAAEATSVRKVCGLWAGMGSILEVTVTPPSPPFIVKLIDCGDDVSSLSDRRKRDSYQCEAAFYSAGGPATDLLAAGLAIPRPLYVERQGENGVVICMTKLEGGGGRRPSFSAVAESKSVLSWLARLHSMYWGSTLADVAVARGLQPQGSYWYLDTRPDEHDQMPRRGWEGRLRLAAKALDERLKASPFQSIVHGDMKSANIMLASSGTGTGGSMLPQPQIYDFQYCGKAACGKDLAYFLTCGSDCDASDEEQLLAHYHANLVALLSGGSCSEERKTSDKGGDDGDGSKGGDAGSSSCSSGSSSSGGEAAAAAAAAPAARAPTLDELKTLVRLSIADLGRWMSGWGWWGRDREQVIREVLDQIDGGKALESERAYVEAIFKAFPLPA